MDKHPGLDQEIESLLEAGRKRLQPPGAPAAPKYKSAIGCMVVLIAIGVLVYIWTRTQ